MNVSVKEDQKFPGIIPTGAKQTIQEMESQITSYVNGSNEVSVVEGKLVSPLSLREQRAFDWFEELGVMYRLEPVKVAKLKGSHIQWIDAQLYVWLEDASVNKTCVLDYSQSWCYDTFRTNHLEWYMKHTVEPCRVQIDRLYPSEDK